MNKKSTLILLSILHICILGICILTIYNNRHSGVTVAHVSSDTKTPVTQTVLHPIVEPETMSERTTEIEIETETITETEIETETETETEIITETIATSKAAALYSFHFIGTRKNLNIRNAPSTNAKIIGTVPIGGSGSVLELTNEYWVLVEYNGIIGYCSRNWIELQKITE